MTNSLFNKTITVTLLALLLSSFVAAQKIAAGGTHSLMICKDSTVWSTGSNEFGQLGNSDFESSTTPIQVQNIDSCIQLAAGWYHSLALKEDGTVWSWGDNEFGQLGDSTLTDRYQPIQVQNLENVIQISAGQFHSAALKADGTVWSWGRNNRGQIGDSTQVNRLTPTKALDIDSVIQIAAGNRFTKVLRENGTVWGWGTNFNGQLGIGDTDQRIYRVQTLNLTNIISISAGWVHSVALEPDGTLWTMGGNWKGELGNTNFTSLYSAVPIQAEIENVLSVSCGYTHSIAIKEDGSVYTWGRNYHGKLGRITEADHDTLPQPVEGLENAISIAGYYQSMVLLNDSTLHTFGKNDQGSLGNGSIEHSTNPVEVDIDCPIVPLILPLELEVSEVENATCKSMCDGSASVEAFFGEGNYSYSWNDPLQQTTSSIENLCPGTYVVTVSSGNQTIQDTVEIESLITVNTIVTNSSSVLTAEANDASYQWLDCDNNFQELPGETNSTFEALQNGSYAVEVTQFDCVDTSECIPVTDVGILESLLESDVQLTPNPTDGLVQINTHHNFRPLYYVIYNSLGQKTSNGSLSPDSNKSLEIKGEPGVYFIKISSLEGTMETFKIIKQ